MTDTRKPLYYRSTGKQLEIVDIEPVVRYCVRWPGGTDVWLTQAEFDEKVTNEKPKYTFDYRSVTNYTRIEGREDAVRVQSRGIYLGVSEVRDLYNKFGRWLADREPSAVVNECGGAQAEQAPQPFGPDTAMG